MGRRRKRIQVLDYFCRYGFFDGDSKCEAVGRERREEIRACLNELFRVRALPYRAKIRDISSIHNSVRMEIHWEADGCHFRWDSNYGVVVEAEPGSLIKYEHLEEKVPQAILDVIEEVQKMDVTLWKRV